MTVTYRASYSTVSMMSRLTRDSYKIHSIHHMWNEFCYLCIGVSHAKSVLERCEFLKFVAEEPHATGQDRDLTIANWAR